MFEVLGIDARQEEVYRALLRSGGCTAAELEDAVTVPAARLQRVLRELEAAGLASRSPDHRIVPARPDVAVEVLVQRRQQELNEARLAASTLLDEYRAHAARRSPVGLVEVVTGAQAIGQRVEQLQRTAREEFLGFDVPPYAVEPSANENVEMAMLARGVRYRVVYHRSALDIPGMLDRILEYAAAGEQGRLLADVPMKLAIADRQMALLPLSLDEPDTEPAAMIVHSSSLLTALASLFEALWERALPLQGAAEAAASDDTRLLLLLTAGLKDDAIARQLGIARRTVQRRLARLQQTLGAGNRLELVVQATRRGMI